MAKAQIDGNDVTVVYAAVGEAIERARAGEGPTFIEALTYRHRGHSRSDPAKYRPPGELELWLERDPIPRCETGLAETGVPVEELAALRESVEREVREALERAEAGPSRSRPTAGSTSGREWQRATEITYREAIVRALRDAMTADEEVFVLGEDVGAAGGPFKLTEGLFEQFGPGRVRDTPISEQAIIGTASERP